MVSVVAELLTESVNMTTAKDPNVPAAKA